MQQTHHDAGCSDFHHWPHLFHYADHDVMSKVLHKSWTLARLYADCRMGLLMSIAAWRNTRGCTISRFNGLVFRGLGNQELQTMGLFSSKKGKVSCRFSEKNRFWDGKWHRRSKGENTPALKNPRYVKRWEVQICKSNILHPLAQMSSIWINGILDPF